MDLVASINQKLHLNCQRLKMPEIFCKSLMSYRKIFIHYMFVCHTCWCPLSILSDGVVRFRGMTACQCFVEHVPPGQMILRTLLKMELLLIIIQVMHVLFYYYYKN